MLALSPLVAAVALLSLGADGISWPIPFTMPTTTTTASPQEACRLPCTCLRLSRWTPRMRAHCLVVWDSDRRPHPPFQLDSVVDEADFAHSRIHKLYAVHLEGMERVKVVQMNGVGLASITTNAFDNLADLWSLKLEDNHLTSLPTPALVRNQRLRYLSLRRNPLVVRPDQPLVAASSLEVLDVSECGLATVFAATFRPLRSLRKLHLEGNLLRALPPEATAPMPQLARLFLQRNNLLFFPSDAIKNLRQLVELQLDGNRLMEGPLGPLAAPKLQYLSAVDCSLDSVQPDLLAAAPELRYLVLHYNRLRSLWLLSGGNASLELLGAAGNPLQCDCALRDTWEWAEQHVKEALVYCGDPPRQWHDAGLHELDCTKKPGPTENSTASATAEAGSAVGGEAGATALWVCLSLLGVLAAVGGGLLLVYRRELLARFFSPQARAAASGGGDALPLERNHHEEVSAGLPQDAGGAGPAWLNQ